jgi:DUF1680 family protein
VGRPYELDDETSYAESCAAVAMAQLTDRIWRLGGDPASLDHLDTLLFNALPAAIGGDGASWCYSNALAFTGDAEQNPWVLGFEYGPAMALKWFPPHRHAWFDVMCCPPNVARAFAGVPSWVAETSVGSAGAPTLLIRLPVASRLVDDAWDVEIRSDWPESGDVEVVVRRAPDAGRLHLRRPGEGIEELASEGTSRLELPVRAGWWEARPELAAMSGKAFLRRGPVVYALDDRDLPGIDLRRLRVDTAAPVDDSDPAGLRASVEEREADPADRPLYAEVDRAQPRGRRLDVTLRPYHAWPDGVGQLRVWLPRVRA